MNYLAMSIDNFFINSSNQFTLDLYYLLKQQVSHCLSLCTNFYESFQQVNSDFVTRSGLYSTAAATIGKALDIRPALSFIIIIIII